MPVDQPEVLVWFILLIKLFPVKDYSVAQFTKVGWNPFSLALKVHSPAEEER